MENDSDRVPLDPLPPLPSPPMHEPPAEDFPEFVRRDARPPARPHMNFAMALLWCLLFLFITQVIPGVIGVGYAFAVVLNRGGGGPIVLEEVVELTVLPAMALSQIASITFSLLVLRLIAGPHWAREIALRKPSLTHVTLTVLLFPAIVLLANGVYALMKKVLPSLADLSGAEGMPGMEEMVQQFGKWPLPLAILIIGVGPGIGEELWCRGFLGRGLVSRYGLVIGVLWTSLLFGLIHIDPRQGTMAALMGIVLHLLYLSTRNLWMPILLHFLNNSTAMIGVKVGGELGKLDQAPETIPQELYVAAGVLFLIVGGALYSCRARLRDLDADGWTWRPAYPGVAYPPTESITRVEHPALHPLLWGFVLTAVGYFAWVLVRVLTAG